MSIRRHRRWPCTELDLVEPSRTAGHLWLRIGCKKSPARGRALGRIAGRFISETAGPTSKATAHCSGWFAQTAYSGWCWADWWTDRCSGPEPGRSSRPKAVVCLPGPMSSVGSAEPGRLWMAGSAEPVPWSGFAAPARWSGCCFARSCSKASTGQSDPDPPTSIGPAWR
jgi:hypothetical protein